MTIDFHCLWAGSGALSRKAFKSAALFEVFSDYLARVSKFTPCGVFGELREDFQKKTGSRIWVCDNNPGSKMLSSEELASVLKVLRDGGVRELKIMIGPSDGFSKKKREALKPDLVWSFGPLTLPHELAAVLACEQTYRAFTILKNLPYHLGH